MTRSFEGGRELGTIVSWDGLGGRIRADNGDRIALFHWSVLQGFRQIRAGQRVEFSRVTLFGLERNGASLVVPVSAEADSD